jgi:hypothetical protein
MSLLAGISTSKIGDAPANAREAIEALAISSEVLQAATV